VPGFISNLDLHWEDEGYSRLLKRLSAFSRLILFDKRGTGLSDRVDTHHLPNLETRMDDVRAVMDAVGSGRAALPTCAYWPSRIASFAACASVCIALRGARRRQPLRCDSSGL